jgi:hypothetical protein
MTGVLLLIAATGAVVAGAVLATRLLAPSSPLDRLVAAVVLGLAQIVLVSIVVGAILHRFDRSSLLVGVVVSDVPLAAAAFLRRGPQASRFPIRETIRELRPWQALLVVAAAGAVAWRLLLAVVLPPFAYDALTYHLTAVASWVQSGRIGPNPYAPCCARYPANAEVLFAWPTVLLGRDTLTDAVQIVSALLGALAVAGLARSAGASRGSAVTAGSLFLLVPIVLTQANSDYNDLTVAAAFLAALHFSARFAAERRLVYAGLAGVSAGLAFGTKTTGVGLAVFVAVGIAAASGRAWRRSGVGVALFAAAVLLTGGWWYAKNWADTGNPVAPFRVRVLGTTIFNGSARVGDYLTTPPGGSNVLTQIARSWYADLHFWTRSEYSYEERSGGLGPLWSWLGWPALGTVALLALRRRRALAAAVLLPAALAFAALPYRWWSRFTLYLAALGVAAIVVLLDRLELGRLRLPAVVAVVGLALAGGGLATWRLDPAGFGRTLSATDVVSLAVHPSRPRTTGALFFQEYAWLQHVPSDATIAVDFDAPAVRFVYPLFGARLDRRVVLLLPGDERRIEALVGDRRPAYLFAAEHGAFARWARAHPRRFRPLEISRGTEAFRLTTILRT